MLWDTKEKLRQLLCELVSWQSETLSEGEVLFSQKLVSKLRELPYFQQNPAFLQTYDVDLGRQVVTALYRAPETEKTLVCISHFDTVEIEEYGSFRTFATEPEKLTAAFLHDASLLDDAAKEDLYSGDYLFGRGVMDMKMGIALHLQLLEKAIVEQYRYNILFVTVPDEEVNSAGMRTAIQKIDMIQQQQNLNVQLFLNGEPSFMQKPGDKDEYIYTGSIGKVLPAALFFGKETHVGEPLKGITAAFMSAYVTKEMEWNEAFLEAHLGEQTPLPVSLQLKDLKQHYSVQTPYKAVALYNVFMLQRTPAQIFDIYEQVVKKAIEQCQHRYEKICSLQHIEPVGKIQVIKFEQLYAYAIQKLTKSTIDAIIAPIVNNEKLDDREKSLAIADALLTECKELAPAVVLLFAPPFYPAVNTSNHPLSKQLVSFLMAEGERYNIPLKQVHYFNGLCDLSYCMYEVERDWSTYEKNTPVWGKTYNIPFETMAKFTAPVMNVGPFGKDAHQIGERLHLKSAFEEMPEMYEKIVQQLIEIA